MPPLAYHNPYSGQLPHSPVTFAATRYPFVFWTKYEDHTNYKEPGLFSTSSDFPMSLVRSYTIPRKGRWEWPKRRPILPVQALAGGLHYDPLRGICDHPKGDGNPVRTKGKRLLERMKRNRTPSLPPLLELNHLRSGLNNMHNQKWWYTIFSNSISYWNHWGLISDNTNFLLEHNRNNPCSLLMVWNHWIFFDHDLTIFYNQKDIKTNINPRMSSFRPTAIGCIYLLLYLGCILLSTNHRL
jgi:hypothetical protein